MNRQMQSSVSVTFERRIANDSAAMCDMMEEASLFCEKQGLAPDVVYAVTICIEEIAFNVIKYGCEDGAQHEIIVRLAINPKQLKLEIEDDAKPFDPFTAPEPESLNGGEPTRAGGLGIFLVKNLMDEIVYRAKSPGNLLILKKTLGTN